MTADHRIGADADEPSFGRQVVRMQGATEERKRAHSDVRPLSTAAWQRGRWAA